MGDPKGRCAEVAWRLRQEIGSAAAARTELAVYVAGLGEGLGTQHQEIVPWHTIPRLRLTGSTYDNLETQLEASRSEQENAIAMIADRCRQAIVHRKHSPIFASLENAVRAIEHQCSVEHAGRCISQRVFVHSDLQELALLTAGREPLQIQAPVRIQVCGVNASQSDLDPKTHRRLMALWKERLGQALVQPMAPTCGGTHG